MSGKLDREAFGCEVVDLSTVGILTLSTGQGEPFLYLFSRSM